MTDRYSKYTKFEFDRPADRVPERAADGPV